jgi:hypothetical protein
MDIHFCKINFTASGASNRPLRRGWAPMGNRPLGAHFAGNIMALIHDQH